MPDLALLVGTTTGLFLYLRRDDVWHSIRHSVPPAHITSLHGLSMSSIDCLLTTREGGLGRLTGSSWRPMHRFSCRLWFSHVDSYGTFFAGGTPPQLLRSLDAGHTWMRSAALESMTRDWRSHSGGPAHLNSVCDGRPFCRPVFTAAEEGGVLTSTNGYDQWTNMTHNLDPDVHKIDIPSWSPTDLYASTGTGLFRISDGSAFWEFLGPPSLRYVQALAHHPDYPFIYVSAARTPFGRHATGEYSGTSSANSFGIFAYEVPTRYWTECALPGKRLAGVLSKALSVAPIPPFGVFVGTTDGIVACVTDDPAPTVIADGLGIIECLHATPVGDASDANV